MTANRVEKDSMGEIEVPGTAYFGAQTQRAVENFPVSGLRFPRPFLRALGLIKQAAAESNMELGLIDSSIAAAIAAAAAEVVEGKFDDQFVVDVFQTGSGTSTNMNANEVIANRAIELLNGRIGSRKVHPNDHVNCCQSSNDVIPSAIHISALEEIEKVLLPALQNLFLLLGQKVKEFDYVIKVARTHLQDAVPIRLGQEFSGYAAMMEHGVVRLKSAYPHLSELAIGGTAVGTGLNCHPDFAEKVVTKISNWTGIRFRQAENRFEAIASRDAAVETSSMLRTVAVSLAKLANDLRWLSSGPRCGIGEIKLPPTQPGSSIMPGKVNPVIPEAVLMVTVQVMGNDAAIAMAGHSGNFELNVMQPLIAYNLLQSIHLLSSSFNILADKCILGLTADRQRCEEMVEKSLAMVTALAPHVGYDKADEVVKEAYRSGRTIREVCLEQNLLSADKLMAALDPRAMTENYPQLPEESKRQDSR